MKDEKYYQAIKDGIREAFLEAIECTDIIRTEQFMKAVQDGVYEAAHGIFSEMRPLHPKDFLFEAIKEGVASSMPIE